MTQSIPASFFVTVNPSVVGAGGSALDMVALMLTRNVEMPIGTVQSFSSAAAVRAYFGSGTLEDKASTIYFNGYDNSSKKPAALLFAYYKNTAASAWMRGGSLAATTLATLQAFGAGTLQITVDGVLATSASINLSGATSFSNAAALIQAGFTSPNFAVSWDSIQSAFQFTSNSTGTSSSVGFCVATGTGTLEAQLKLTQSKGAFLSAGWAATNPTTFMNSIVDQTTNWAAFMTLNDPDAGSGNAAKLAFATWCGSQNNRYAYICWDTDASPTTTLPATTSLGYLLTQANTPGTCLIYAPTYDKAAFICGAIAALDFSAFNGRLNFAYTKQSGLSADVTSQQIASNLLANAYNFYGATATANQGFVWFYNGQTTGPFKWLDSYVCQIYLNNALQLALMTLLGQVNSLPYNAQGYALIRQACIDPINAAINFGTIRGGVTLSALQAAEVNNMAGLAIDKALSVQGWYLQILDATAQVRGARQSPPITLWYMDGGSVNQITLNSVEVQ